MEGYICYRAPFGSFQFYKKVPEETDFDSHETRGFQVFGEP